MQASGHIIRTCAVCYGRTVKLVTAMEMNHAIVTRTAHVRKRFRNYVCYAVHLRHIDFL